MPLVARERSRAFAIFRLQYFGRTGRSSVMSVTATFTSRFDWCDSVNTNLQIIVRERCARFIQRDCGEHSAYHPLPEDQVFGRGQLAEHSISLLANRASGRCPASSAAGVPGRSEYVNTCRYVKGRLSIKRRLSSKSASRLARESRPSRRRRSPHPASARAPSERGPHNAAGDTCDASAAASGPIRFAAARGRASRSAATRPSARAGRRRNPSARPSSGADARHPSPRAAGGSGRPAACCCRVPVPHRPRLMPLSTTSRYRARQPAHLRPPPAPRERCGCGRGRTE